MGEETRSQAAERFRVTLDLFEAGLEIMRQNLRRQHPEESERELDARLNEWLHHRPGAEHGDCPRRRVDWVSKTS